jgi:plasmid stabilization system protein ParE
MSLRIIYQRIAREEFDRSIDWYEFQRPGLGAEFEAEVRAMLQDIQRQPNRYPLITRVTRMSILRRFPFSIYYRVLSDVIFIVAVYHHSRDPDGWKHRR